MLAVMAHPDDEAFALGGTLALYANRGVQVHLICATKGEVGTVSPEFLAGYDDIAELRMQELDCAAEQLGLAGLRVLDYRDSGMVGTPDNEHPRALAQANQEQVVEAVSDYMRRVEPQVVITHDPQGGYGHPDHIAIHKATVEAYHAVSTSERAYRPQRLYFSIFSFRFLRPFLTLLRITGRDPRKWGRNQDIDLTEAFSSQFPVHAKVHYRSVARQKRRAIACHASQLDSGPAMRGPVGLFFRLDRYLAVETFMRADPPVTNGRTTRDLFEGVRLETSS